MSEATNSAGLLIAGTSQRGVIVELGLLINGESVPARPSPKPGLPVNEQPGRTNQAVLLPEEADRRRAHVHVV